jgi:hypothetical protein
MLNIGKRAPLVRQASKILHDDVGCVLLGNNISVFAMKANMRLDRRRHRRRRQARPAGAT